MTCQFAYCSCDLSFHYVAFHITQVIVADDPIAGLQGFVYFVRQSHSVNTVVPVFIHSQYKRRKLTAHNGLNLERLTLTTRPWSMNKVHVCEYRRQNVNLPNCLL